MELAIILVLSVTVIILALCLLATSKQVTDLGHLLDKMDVALAKQHEVIDNQQGLIDSVMHNVENNLKSVSKEN